MVFKAILQVPICNMKTKPQNPHPPLPGTEALPNRLFITQLFCLAPKVLLLPEIASVLCPLVSFPS